MSIFNKLFKNSPNNAPSPSENEPTTPWDSMKEVPFAGNTFAGNIIQSPAKLSSEQIAQEIDTLTELSSEQSAEILQQTRIDGSTYTNASGKDFTLTPEILEQNGLAPQYAFQMEGYNINLSNSFKILGHDAAIAYIQTPNGETKARSYYRSESTGLWRLCPDYGRNNGINIWFGKGYSEESLTLPFQFQKHLNDISEKGNAGTKPPLCFFGTAQRYASSREYNFAKATNATLPGDYPQEVKHNSSFNFPIELPPERLDITGKIAPNFQKEISSYSTHSKTYGDYRIHLFPSADGRWIYSMCETTDDGNRKAWIGNIEMASSPIGSTGCHQEWINPGDLGMPLYEYPDQDNGYGDHGDTRGAYVGMWGNYLSKSPLIQRYLKETSQD